MRRPINAPINITQGFAENPAMYAQFGLAGHHGVDYAASIGTAVYAPESGVIEKSANGITDKYTGKFAAGETITLVGTHEHWLMHLNQRLVGAGQRVNEGDLIGYSGNTGYTTGPHVHWGTRPLNPNLSNGYRGFIDPARVLFATPAPAPAAPAILPNQRVVGSAGVNERERPDTSAPIARDWQPGEILNFKGYVLGGPVGTTNNNRWLVGAVNGRYFWSGSFEDTGTHDLPDLTAPVIAPPPPAPTPVPTPTPTPVIAPFEKELPSVTEVIPPHPTNFEVGNFPAQPTKVVIHDFGTPGRDTLGSSLNQFQLPDTTSPHFTVSKGRRIQNVSLKNRAYHAGPNGNNFIGIESDPVQDDETIASVNMILADLKNFYGYAPEPIKHSSIVATLCGDDVNLDNYKEKVPETPTRDYGEENNSLLKQILGLVQWIVDKLKGVFK